MSEKEEKDEEIKPRMKAGRPSKKTLSGKTARRDHLIVQNEYYFDIKKGDDLSDIPDSFYETLKTEKII